MSWILIFGAVCFASEPIQTLPEKGLSIQNKEIVVEVADEPHERRLGLMYRKKLSEDKGMLFVYDKEKMRSFWMKNTYIPLTIAFLNKEGLILHIADMEPLNLKSVSSKYPVQFALEMNRDWFTKNKIVTGDKIIGLPTGNP